MTKRLLPIIQWYWNSEGPGSLQVRSPSTSVNSEPYFALPVSHLSDINKLHILFEDFEIQSTLR